MFPDNVAIQVETGTTIGGHRCLLCGAWVGINNFHKELALIEKIQNYIDDNNIYQVVFGHYDESGSNWVSLKTNRINIVEVLKNEYNG